MGYNSIAGVDDPGVSIDAEPVKKSISSVISPIPGSPYLTPVGTAGDAQGMGTSTQSLQGSRSLSLSLCLGL